MRTCKRRNAQTCRVTALCAVLPRSPSSQRQYAECRTGDLLGRNARSCLHSLSNWGEIREVAVTHSLGEMREIAVTRSLLEEKCAKVPSLALYLRRNARRWRHSLSTWGEMREVAITRSLLEKFAELPSLALYLRRNARSCRHSLSTWEERRRAGAQMTLLKVQQHLGGTLQVGLPQVWESGHGRTVQHPSKENC